MSKYDLSSKVTLPDDGRAMTYGKGEEMHDVCVWEAIVIACNMPSGQNEQLTIDDIAKRRKVMAKLRKAENKAEISFKAETVTFIKEVVRKYYIPGISIQIFDAFDGEVTEAQLDDV